MELAIPEVARISISAGPDLLSSSVVSPEYRNLAGCITHPVRAKCCPGLVLFFRGDLYRVPARHGTIWSDCFACGLSNWPAALDRMCFAEEDFESKRGKKRFETRAADGIWSLLVNDCRAVGAFRKPDRAGLPAKPLLIRGYTGLELPADR